jgi:hypothetical protein
LNKADQEVFGKKWKGQIEGFVTRIFSFLKSTLTLKEVDDFLNSMNELTKSSDQMKNISTILEKCTGGRKRSA